MNPNLEYSQVIRGPDGSKTGTHLGNIRSINTLTLAIADNVTFFRRPRPALFHQDRVGHPSDAGRQGRCVDLDARLGNGGVDARLPHVAPHKPDQPRREELNE